MIRTFPERPARALALTAILVAGAARADPAPLLLPTRAPERAAWAERVRDVAAALVRARGGRIEEPAPPLVLDLDEPLAKARAGAIDEAAPLLDRALDLGAAAPGRVADPAQLVEAHLARATIALARGEAARARELTERLVRWDPAIALGPSEGSPRLRAAIDQAKQALGPAPALAPEDMDGCARGSLLVGRRRDASTLELLRVDGCKVASRALLTTAGDERAALALLGGSAAPPPARRPRSRTWIWGVAIAAALVAAAAAVIGALAARPTSEVLDVAPHL